MKADEWQAPTNGMRLRRASSRPIRQIQIFGQRCSGTNVLAKLIVANFGVDAVTDRYGFKHWFVPDQILIPDHVLVVVIARNAFDWVRSLHRQPWHVHPELKGLPFSSFIRAEWHSYWDGEFDGIDPQHPLFNREMMHERDPATGLRFGNALLKRTAKLRAWSGMTERASNVALIDQQTLVASPAALVEALGRLLGQAASGDVTPVASYKGNGFNRFVPRQYEPLSEDDDAFVRSQLDAEIEDRFGFEIGRLRSSSATTSTAAEAGGAVDWKEPRRSPCRVAEAEGHRRIELTPLD